MKIAGFDLDTGNWPKCGKHGLSQAEIEEVFARTPGVLADPFPEEARMRDDGSRAPCFRGVPAPRDRRPDKAAAHQRPLHALEGDRAL